MVTKKAFARAALLLPLLVAGIGPLAHAAPVRAPVIGEIESITLNNANDPWSGGTIFMGGQGVILPRNLLIDLPANRLTLKQIFDQAPAACRAKGESGLAKNDLCNTSGIGGYATIAANLTNGGNVIAGDVLIQKGIETLAGMVTFIDYTDGYFRVNGVAGNAASGVMVRINDPTGRHTVQQGLGCLPGTANCSPDPRFTTDPDSYINAFTTGYPVCLPSTVPRPFVDVLDFNGNGNITELLTAVSTPAGTGDILCPDTNRSINGGQPVDDSRRFAPLQVGDHVTVVGNYETINCVHFLSSHNVQVSRQLSTKNLATQPDYLFISQAFIEAPGFQDQKLASVFFGETTRAPADIVIWSVHQDPVAGQPHEFLLATTLGCDAAAGVGTCTAKGVLPATGGDIFSVSHVVDFRFLPTAPALNPCAHLRADSRFIPLNVCPGGGTFAEQFSILSPLPRQIHARTGQKLTNPGLATLDIQGRPAPNGQYYMQMGIGLASILIPDLLGVNLNLVSTPFGFSGIPWNLDRRLSPGGCPPTGCEATPQPLDPFPYEGIDPRIQAATPTGPYIDPNFNRGILTVANNRVLSYVSGTAVGGVFNFNGNSTILAWPPVDPAALPAPAAPPVPPRPPVVTITSAPVFTATVGQLYSYQVAATNASACGGLTYSLTQAPAGMTISAAGLIQWTPTAFQAGPRSAIVQVTEPGGTFDTQSFGIVVGSLGPSPAPKAVKNDFDGDGKMDFTVWREGSGTWYVTRSSDHGVTQTQWGTLHDKPVPGDYDGDGKTDLAVWRPSDGNWYIIRSSDGTPTRTQWGTGTLFPTPDVPVPGDYDGDGKTDLAVWRPSDGNWYIIRSSDGAVTRTQWGTGTLFTTSDIPVPGDYDGDGKTDLAVWRPSDGNWYIIRSSDGAVTQTQWGTGTLFASPDIPVPGDYDGDGKTDLAVWRPSDGNWYIIRSSDGAVIVTRWGAGSLNDIPVPGDYDGDGKTDIAIWRPGDGNWYVIPSGIGIPVQFHWGGDPTDVPIGKPIR